MISTSGSWDYDWSRTVNQDVINTYHLFYGDAKGTPGTEMTFFEWPNAGPHFTGSGDLTSTVFVVPDEPALEWWTKNFDDNGVAHGIIEERRGQAGLAFTDAEGQRLELVVGERADVAPWSGSSIPEEVAIRGFASVKLAVSNLEPTTTLLTSVLGFRQSEEYHLAGEDAGPVSVFETGPRGIGAEVHVTDISGGGRARVGIGGVHHVALRTPDDEEHVAWQERLAKAGVEVTPVIDRYYFKSIYFREPGGVLFEIATDGPGFTADEDVEQLGEHLSLPPFLEPRRAFIEASLDLI